MKRLSICILTLAVALGSFASDWRLERINSIKKNRNFLYGEVTDLSREKATTLAYEQLQNEVYAWLQNDSISVKEINRLADTIMVQFVNPHVYRVFAYVEKTKIKPVEIDTVRVDTIPKKAKTLVKTTPEKKAKPLVKIAPEKKDTALFTDTVRQVIHKRFFGQEGKKKQRQNDALLRIKKAKNFFELKEIMLPLKEKGDIIDYGKYATAKHPELCYLIVYDPAGNICALLGRGKEVRQNLKTGRKDTIKNYRGCGAIWFTLRDDEIKNN